MQVKTTNYWLANFEWAKWVKRFGDGHKFHHSHVPMIKGMIYTILAISFNPYKIQAFHWEYSKLIFSILQWLTKNLITMLMKLVYNYYTLYHCHIEMTNSTTITESLNHFSRAQLAKLKIRGGPFFCMVSWFHPICTMSNGQVAGYGKGPYFARYWTWVYTGF